MAIHLSMDLDSKPTKNSNQFTTAITKNTFNTAADIKLKAMTSIKVIH